MSGFRCCSRRSQLRWGAPPADQRGAGGRLGIATARVLACRERRARQFGELPAAQVDALRKELKLEEGPPPAPGPAAGDRPAQGREGDRARGRRAPPAGLRQRHNTADEGQLRRFDHVREDRRGRGGKKPRRPDRERRAGREAVGKPFKQRKQKGPKPLPDGNPARSAPGTCPGASTPAQPATATPTPAARKPFNRSLGPGGGQGQGQGPAQGRGDAGQGPSSRNKSASLRTPRQRAVVPVGPRLAGQLQPVRRARRAAPGRPEPSKGPRPGGGGNRGPRGGNR